MKKSLLLVALLASIGIANAAQTTLEAQGTIGTTCTFGTTTAGVLATSATAANVIDSTASPATFKVDYNAGVTVVVTGPTTPDASPTNTQNPTITTTVSSVNAGTVNMVNNIASMTETGSAVTDTFTVKNFLTWASGYVPATGTYKVSNVITCQ